MFGRKKLKSRVAALENQVGALFTLNDELKDLIAISEFKSKHKPLFKNGDVVNGYDVLSSNYTSTKTKPTLTQDHQYVLGRYITCNYTIKSQKYPNSAWTASEYWLFTQSKHFGDDEAKFKTLTTKK